ncbi:MAG: DegV family protein [Bacilli bacterium]|nr:DegV family protein [Bacilli bacterium]
MKKIKIICDSTFNLPEDYIKANDISVVPLSVVINETSYRDQIDIQLEEVMEAVDMGSKVTTSQPAPSLYMKLFNNFKDEGFTDILCFTISSTLSGTFSGANLAKENTSGINIHLIDTLSASIGSEMLLREAILDLQSGKEIPEVLQKVEDLKENATILLCMENLKNLKLSGRITKIKATIGNLLHVKPILEYFGGKLSIHSKFRTEKSVFNYIIERLKTDFQKAKSKFLIYLSHVRSLAKVENLKVLIEDALKTVKVHISNQITPVIAINIGYGGYGVSWCYE